MNSRGGLGRSRLKKLYALVLACAAMWVTLTAEASDAEEAYFSVFPETQVQTEDHMYSIVESLEEPVLEAGGGWDSLDVLNPSVVAFHGLLYNYYSGWDGNTWRTGLAVSENGTEWEKEDHYLLDTRNDFWDNSYIAANGSAVCVDDRIYYYYQSLDASDGRSKIGLAVSSDGRRFEERTDVPVLEPGRDKAWDSHAVADPYVIAFGGQYYMYYLGTDNVGVQRLGAAVSKDGLHWTKYQRNPVLDIGARGTFDENGLGEPSVIYKAPYFFMLYTGRNNKEQRNIGIAVSRDGVNFKKLQTE